jgi:hypothetical protein
MTLWLYRAAVAGDRRTPVPAALRICACLDEEGISHKTACDAKLARTPTSRRNLLQEKEVKIVDPEWLRMSSSPGMWIIAFIFAGNALVASFFFYRLAMRTGRRMKMKEEVLHEALKASFITSIF